MSIANKTKHWLRDLVRYPSYRTIDTSYNLYWEKRDMSAPLNDFQKKRAQLVLGWLGDNDSVLDVGSGDGRILAYLKERKSGIRVRGVDSSDEAIRVAHSRGIKSEKVDLRELSGLDRVEEADWVLLLEVIEHFPDSERLLKWAHEHARKGVIFSVPNTGFIVHRLRLLLGRFPLQWRVHPSEHLRFWTLRDMKWWLHQLHYKYELHTYEGVPLLNRAGPSLFSAGIVVMLPK